MGDLSDELGVKSTVLEFGSCRINDSSAVGVVSNLG